MIAPSRLVALGCLLAVAQLPPAAPDVDPDLRAAVEAFFAAQEAEDATAYLALWSRSARRPTPQMLQYVFDSGDDRYSDIVITRVTATPAGRTRLRVAATRARTVRARDPDAPPVTRSSAITVSLVYVREEGAWKLVSEGPGWDELADALLEAGSAEERHALMKADPDLVEARLLLSIARRASEAAQAQQFAAAAARYQVMAEVARVLGEQRHEAEALQNLGNAYYSMRNFAAAIAAYEERLALDRGRGEEEGVAAALGGIATSRYSSAEYTAAMTAYREAMGIQERLGHEAALATTLISIGNILYVQGDYEAAIAEYARSRALYRKLLNTIGEARALEGLGRAAMARGDYARALEAFAGVLDEGRARRDPVVQGTALMSIGDVHFRLGNVDVARTSFVESRKHFEEVKDAANVGRAWQALGVTELLAARFEVAEASYRKSIESCSAAGDGECTGAAWAGLGFAQTAQDKFAEAVPSYTKAIEIFTSLKQAENMARAQVGLAQALTGGGEHEAAIASATEARRTAIGRGLDDVLWRALIAEARALRRLEDPAAALAAARAAAGALQRLTEQARVQPDKPVARDTATIFRTLALLHAEAGDARAAFDAVERMRVHDLRATLAGVEREIARGMTDAEREAERNLARELVGIHVPLARQKALPKPDRDALAALEARAADAAARQDAHRARVFARLPELPFWRGIFEPVTASDLELFLASPDVAVLQLVMEDDDLIVVTARRGEAGLDVQAAVTPVKRKTLAEAVAKLMQYASLRDHATWRSVAGDLVHLLPPLVFDTVAGSQQIIVVPHDVLWRIPFEALPAGAATLGDATRVRYVHSLSGILRAPVRPAGETVSGEALSAKPQVVFGAAAPALHDTMRERLDRVAPGWKRRAPEPAIAELSHAGDTETEVVVTLTGGDLTEAALRDQLSRADVAQIGLPFRINVASPLFSPLVMAGEVRAEGGDPAADAALELREVMNLDLRAGLILFTDGSAMAAREAADDVAIVQWAWQAAGAQSVLVLRWPGDDAATAALLAAFHDGRRRGAPPAEALREAQTTLRRAEETAAPYYWAGWMLMSAR